MLKRRIHDIFSDPDLGNDDDELNEIDEQTFW